MKVGRIILAILVVTTVVVVAYWYVTTQNTSTVSSALTGSGTVETTEVAIAPEMSGKVVDVLVNEGDAVKAGNILFKLDDTLLNAQKDQAQANLGAAQAGLDAANTALAAAQAGVTTAHTQYDLTLASSRLQAQPSRLAAWSQPEPSEFSQPNWYFSHTEEITAALQEVSAASAALDTAKTNYNSLVSSGTYTNLTSTEARLAQAQTAFLDARDVLNRAQTQNNRSLRDVAQQNYDAAKAELDAAQKAYDDLLTTQEVTDVLDARAHLAAAQDRNDTAVDRYNSLLTAEDSLTVKVAADTLAQAQANVTAVQSKVTQAQKAIDQAKAALSLIDLQLEKLVITSPNDGVILARNIEPGEVMLAGATAMTIGQPNDLTITVYIPENRYGEVKLADAASVSVDSFPNQTFDATVTRIADQAEFTPRNVQTAEGRATTVYAVQLAVQNPGGLLKPGMPADVTFK
jgi:multidrug resistance efflux pump